MVCLLRVRAAQPPPPPRRAHTASNGRIAATHPLVERAVGWLNPCREVVDRLRQEVAVRALNIVWIAIAAASAAGAPAWGTISVDPPVTQIAFAENARADVLVTNNGEARAFVVVKPARIDNPGTAAEARLESADPSDVGLLAAPRRLVLEPGASQVVRLAILDADPAREQVFRVLFDQVVGGVEGAGDVGVGVAVLISFDALVLARPDSPAPDLHIERVEDQVRIANRGNASAMLFDGEACRADACRPLQIARLYPGADVAYDVAADEQARITAEWPGGERRDLDLTPAP